MALVFSDEEFNEVIALSLKREIYSLGVSAHLIEHAGQCGNGSCPHCADSRCPTITFGQWMRGCRCVYCEEYR